MISTTPTSSNKIIENKKSLEQQSKNTEYYMSRAYLIARNGNEEVAQDFISLALESACKENKIITPQEIDAVLKGEVPRESNNKPAPVSSYIESTNNSNSMEKLEQNFQKEVDKIKNEFMNRIKLWQSFINNFQELSPSL